MAETKVSDPIITFKNVSKTYTLYKDDKARFKALFFKPRNAKTNKALNNVSMVINRGESVGIVGEQRCRQVNSAQDDYGRCISRRRRNHR